MIANFIINQNGSSNPEVVSRFFQICDIVEKCNFSIDKPQDEQYFNWFLIKLIVIHVENLINI